MLPALYHTAHCVRVRFMVMSFIQCSKEEKSLKRPHMHAGTLVIRYADGEPPQLHLSLSPCPPLPPRPLYLSGISSTIHSSTVS